MPGNKENTPRGDFKGQLVLCVGGGIHRTGAECESCGTLKKMCHYCAQRILLKGPVFVDHDAGFFRPKRCLGSGDNARK